MNQSPFSFHPFRGGEAVTEYVHSFRRSDLPPIQAGAPLDLYPSRPESALFPRQLTWDDPWPYGDRAGVYLLYDEALNLLYVGKASMNRRLGQRLYEYFGGGEVCHPRLDWLRPARYVIIVAMPAEFPFEAPALEEFLIRRLQPKLNGVGL